MSDTITITIEAEPTFENIHDGEHYDALRTLLLRCKQLEQSIEEVIDLDDGPGFDGCMTWADLVGDCEAAAWFLDRFSGMIGGHSPWNMLRDIERELEETEAREPTPTE